MASQEIALNGSTPTGLSLVGRLHGLVVTVDHKKLGLMYVGTALGFLVVAGLMAVAIRLQLAAKSVRKVTTGTRSVFVRRMRPSTSDASGYTDTIVSGRNSLIAFRNLRRVNHVSTMIAGARRSGASR